MKRKLLTVAILAGLMLTACDDSTDTIGSSLSTLVDDVNVETAVFNVESRSIVADSVLSKNVTGYLGEVRDPETNAYVTGDFMAQFYCIENYRFPSQSSLVTNDANGDEVKGKVVADSCEVRLFYANHYGDSTQTMKLTLYEMDKVMNEDRSYYSNFDPLKSGFVRKDGIQKDKVYTLTDFNIPENVRDTANYTPYLTVKLNEPYTDKAGKTYANYGSYVMQKYYDAPSNFKNAYTFRNNVVPGFFFKHKAGLGSMAYIDASQLNIYYRYTQRVPYTTTVNGQETTQYRDSVMHGISVFWGTEEVLQSTTITNDKATLEQLANEQGCTYLKTPAGIFTEMTLPVDEITTGHEKEHIQSAKVSIQRINNNLQSEYAFDVPEHVLMIPKDSLYSFFENSELYNNRTSYVATWSYGSSSSPAGNDYVFSNISELVKAMSSIDKAQRSANWNKVVLIPVSLETTSNSSSSSYGGYGGLYYGYGYGYGSSSSSQTTVTKLSHDMSLTSTRLVKGTTADSPIKMEVIYSNFK